MFLREHIISNSIWCKPAGWEPNNMRALTPAPVFPGCQAIITGLAVAIGLTLAFQQNGAALHPASPPVSAPTIRDQKIISRPPESVPPVGKHSRVNYSGFVRTAALRHGLDPGLINAIIAIESGGNSVAVSPKGAKGLMQLMPSVCKKYRVKDPFNAQQNVFAGTAYLAYLLKSLDGDLELALGAYHCGLPRIIENEGVMTPGTGTYNFVRSVLSRYSPAGEELLP